MMVVCERRQQARACDGGAWPSPHTVPSTAAPLRLHPDASSLDRHNTQRADSAADVRRANASARPHSLLLLLLQRVWIQRHHSPAACEEALGATHRASSRRDVAFERRRLHPPHCLPSIHPPLFLSLSLSPVCMYRLCLLRELRTQHSMTPSKRHSSSTYSLRIRSQCYTQRDG